MHAQASPDGCYRDQLRHEVRELFFQLRELVHHDHQMRQRLRDLVVPVHLRVIVDIVGSGVRQDPLPPDIFTVDGDQCPVDLVAAQVGNGPGQMRQPVGGIVELVRQSSALEVHQQERDVLRGVVDGQREDPGHQHLRFPGSGGAGHQSVGAVGLFVHVEHAGNGAGAHADRHLDAVEALVRSPAGEDPQILNASRPVHVEEGQNVRDLLLGIRRLDPHPGEPCGKRLHTEGLHQIEADLLPAAPGVAHRVAAAEGGVVLDHILALVGQMSEILRADEGIGGDVHVLIKEIDGGHIALQKLRGSGQDHVARRVVPGLVVLRQLPAVLQHRVQLAQDLADALPGLSGVAEALVIRPHVRQPFRFLEKQAVQRIGAVHQEYELQVGIIVVGGQLSDQCPQHRIAARPVHAADNANEGVFPEADARRHVVEDPVLVPDARGFSGQLVLDQREMVRRHLDLLLEILFAGAQTHEEIVLLVPVAVPQALAGVVVGQALLRGGIGAGHQARVVLIGSLDLRLLLLEVRLVFRVALLFFGDIFLLLVLHVLDRPEGHADGRASHHQKPRWGEGTEQEDADQHRDHHGKRRSDGGDHRFLLQFLGRGRPVDLHGLRVVLRHLARRRAEEDLLLRVHGIVGDVGHPLQRRLVGRSKGGVDLRAGDAGIDDRDQVSEENEGESADLHHHTVAELRALGADMVDINHIRGGAA